MRWHQASSARVFISCAFAGSSGRPLPNIIDRIKRLVRCELEASTHDWAADEIAVSGEVVEMISSEEFFKDTA